MPRLHAGRMFRVIVDQGPNPHFDIATTDVDGMQFIFLLKVAGDPVEARIASTDTLLTAIPKRQLAQLCWQC